ncbi:MAG: hypothetical protein LBM08_07335 [Dysgonamonadaceae bacterium]|jgi:hypothetical protein|nr:hypothetical protein [Dysgonamonadaceae bacterium]
MEKVNHTGDQLLDKLRHTHPVLDNPDELTGNILRKIEHLQNVKEKNRIWLATAWVSGIVAACFFGFMIWEIEQSPVSTAFIRYIPSVRTEKNPESDMHANRQQYYRALEKKQKIKSTKHRLYTNYISYLNNQ